MFNRQLRKNIAMLDGEIGKLSEEINGLKKDTKYDEVIRVLDDLTELRAKLTKSLKENETSDVVIELDKRIEEQTMIIKELHSDVAYMEKIKKLDELTKVRCQLAEAKSKESNAPVIISGLVGLSAIALVLHYEKTDIITSKAFSIATRMFRGM